MMHRMKGVNIKSPTDWSEQQSRHQVGELEFNFSRFAIPNTKQAE